MTEHDIRTLIAEVRSGRLSRRAFVQTPRMRRLDRGRAGRCAAILSRTLVEEPEIRRENGPRR